MFISLSIDSFKNHINQSYFWGGKNILIGPNGSGKTNILEAIYLFINGLPPQEKVFTQLVPIDIGILSIGGSYFKNDLCYTGRITHTKGEGKVYFLSQESIITRVRHIEIIPMRAVLFTPIEMNILYLGPSLRRDFLDEAILLAFPEFGKVKQEYHSVLKNRNNLLKKIREGIMNSDTLNVWDALFIEKTKAYYQYRRKLIQFILDNMSSVKSLLENKYNLTWKYITKIDIDSIDATLAHYLTKNRDRDIMTGHTYIGPHLDDFQCIINDDILSNDYLSRGENKTILIGLKFILIKFIENFSKKETILLLDDLFSELDSEHIESIISNAGERQLFITTQNLPHFFKEKQEFSLFKI